MNNFRDAGIKRAARRGIIHVELSVRRITRIERKTKQTLFAANRQTGNSEKRSRVQCSSDQIQNTNLPVLLDNKYPVKISGRRGDEQRLSQSRRDADRVESLYCLPLQIARPA